MSLFCLVEEGLPVWRRDLSLHGLLGREGEKRLGGLSKRSSLLDANAEIWVCEAMSDRLSASVDSVD